MCGQLVMHSVHPMVRRHLFLHSRCMNGAFFQDSLDAGEATEPHFTQSRTEPCQAERRGPETCNVPTFVLR